MFQQSMQRKFVFSKIGFLGEKIIALVLHYANHEHAASFCEKREKESKRARGREIPREMVRAQIIRPYVFTQ